MPKDARQDHFLEMLKETKLLWGKREDLHIDALLVKRQNGRVRANYQLSQ